MHEDPKVLQCGAPKRYKLVNITPSNYGYNYHKPKREIVVMFTN